MKTKKYRHLFKTFFAIDLLKKRSFRLKALSETENYEE